MLDVAMTRVGVFVVLEPLLELPVLSDLEWRKTRARGAHLAPEAFVDSKNLTRVDQMTEKSERNLRIHVRAHAKSADRAVRHAIAILWRH